MTKDDSRGPLAPFAARQELRRTISEDGERTRRHMDVVAEGLRRDLRLLAEDQMALLQHIDEVGIDLKADLARIDRRLMRLEAAWGLTSVESTTVDPLC